MKLNCYKPFYFFSWILLSMFFFISCENNALSDVDTTPNDIQLKDCIILQDNQELLSILTLLDEGKTSKEINKLENFYSMWDVYAQMLKSKDSEQVNLLNEYPNIAEYDEDGDLKLKILDEMLTKILNPQGFLIIDKNIVKVEGDIIKVITNGDESRIPELETITSSTEDGIFLIDRFIPYSPEQLKGTEDYTWYGTEYGGSTKRVKWEKYGRSSEFFIYSYVGGDIKYQEKTAIGWIAKKTYMTIRVSCAYVTYNCSNGVCSIEDNIRLYDDGVAKTLKVTQRLGAAPVSTINGLYIQFKANGIEATK